MKSLLVSFATGALLWGCATVQSGPVGIAVDASNHPLLGQPRSSLRVSAGEIPAVASPYFGLVEVTFENESPKWERIDHLALDFGGPERNRDVQIPWGDQIESWFQAIDYRNAIRRANTARAVEALASVGAFLRANPAGSQPKGADDVVLSAGGLPQIGSPAPAVASSKEADSNVGLPAGAFSGGHLLSMPIRVPPGLFAKRWILFFTPVRPRGGCIDQVSISFDVANGERHRVLLHFKVADSQWQQDDCKTLSEYPRAMS